LILNLTLWGQPPGCPAAQHYSALNVVAGSIRSRLETFKTAHISDSAVALGA
jgi:hypothetical protein